jgi:CBS domain-containing protein
MAEHRMGSAVVAHNGKLLGIFTTTDALRALAAVLEEVESAETA